MTKERLGQLRELQFAEESGSEYLELSEKQESYRAKINCLLGNAPQFIHEDTLENCWVLMKYDVEYELERLRKELEEA